MVSAHFQFCVKLLTFQLNYYIYSLLFFLLCLLGVSNIVLCLCLWSWLYLCGPQFSEKVSKFRVLLYFEWFCCCGAFVLLTSRSRPSIPLGWWVAQGCFGSCGAGSGRSAATRSTAASCGWVYCILGRRSPTDTELHARSTAAAHRLQSETKQRLEFSCLALCPPSCLLAGWHQCV